MGSLVYLLSNKILLQAPQMGKEVNQSVRADPRSGNAIEVYGQDICDRMKIVVMEFGLNRVFVLAHKLNFCELFLTLFM
jgi:hypothetical protein